ncbi:MAG: 2OG-Fe(II) oxygenase family protein [Asticcacaulis sp.]
MRSPYRPCPVSNCIASPPSAIAPGDFFTRHTDAAARLCFEWNFTEGWRPDWGGQVLFHSPSGDIEGGILPRLNDLALFSGDQPRSIASVAPLCWRPALLPDRTVRLKLTSPAFRRIFPP